MTISSTLNKYTKEIEYILSTERKSSYICVPEMYLKCTRFGSKSASQEFQSTIRVQRKNRVHFEYNYGKFKYISSTCVLEMYLKCTRFGSKSASPKCQSTIRAQRKNRVHFEYN